MYFLIACREEPPRSFKLLIAPLTISDVRGCAGLLRGFFDAAAAFAFLAGDAATAGAGVATAVSAMVE